MKQPLILEPGMMYKTFATLPLFPKETGIDKKCDECAYGFGLTCDKHSPIDIINHGDMFMFLKQSVKCPYTYKVLFRDLSGWIQFGMAPIEEIIEQVNVKVQV